MITGIRNRLGLESPTKTAERWWADRMDDLLTLQPEIFAKKYGKSIESVTQFRNISRALLACADGQQQGVKYLADLRSNKSTKDLAQQYEYQNAATPASHRKTLRILNMAGRLEVINGFISE